MSRPSHREFGLKQFDLCEDFLNTRFTLKLSSFSKLTSHDSHAVNWGDKEELLCNSFSFTSIFLSLSLSSLSFEIIISGSCKRVHVSAGNLMEFKRNERNDEEIRNAKNWSKFFSQCKGMRVNYCCPWWSGDRSIDDTLNTAWEAIVVNHISRNCSQCSDFSPIMIPEIESLTTSINFRSAGDGINEVHHMIRSLTKTISPRNEQSTIIEKQLPIKPDV